MVCTFFRSLIFCAACLPIFLGACSTVQLHDGYAVDNRYRAISHNERISSLVLHATELPYQPSLDILTHGKVSAHYLVPDILRRYQGKPVVLNLVDEKQRAWHAGESYWNGRSNLNDTSIGIEIVNMNNTSKAHSGQPYTDEQIQLIIQLAKDIIKRYSIKATDVLAHSDVAPQRKRDPGPLFPWKKLAENGVGAWPDEATVTECLANSVSQMSILELQGKLKRYGYSIELTGKLDVQTRKVVSAFQMHFRPEIISGEPDEETEAILNALLIKYRQ